MKQKKSENYVIDEYRASIGMSKMPILSVKFKLDCQFKSMHDLSYIV